LGEIIEEAGSLIRGSYFVTSSSETEIDFAVKYFVKGIVLLDLGSHGHTYLYKKS